jgi:AcrR family transcriptional regulator
MTETEHASTRHHLVEPEPDESTETRSGRDRILAHARTLFIERGFTDVSMREIADAAGLRKASIYHHFRDKEALFTAIVLEETIDLRHRMEESIVGVEGFRARLDKLTEIQMLSTRSHSMRLAEDFRSHIPEHRHEEMHRELRELFAIYETLFTEAHAAGEITGIEPSLAASCFFQIVLSLSWDWLETGGPVKPEPRELADLAVRIMLYGIAGPPSR